MTTRWLALLLITGCAVRWEQDVVAPTDPIFPHAEDWAQGTRHGADALAEERLGACLGCHVEDSTTAPACADCHEVYPHRTGWLAGAEHGAGLVGADADLSACLACHGDARLVAGAQVGCTTCHASFPHAEGWAAAGGHGRYALDRGGPVAVCGPCHGSDLAGGDPGVGCTDCHALFPHPEGWSDPASHGAAAGPTCFGCHGEMGTGGTSGVSCARCHAVYPHPQGWESTHLATADRVGERTCLGCHAPGDGPSTMVARCATACHGGAP